MRRERLIAAVAVAAILCGAAAHAQQLTADQVPTTQASRPYRGVFDAGTAARPGGHLLSFTATFSPEYGNTQNGQPAGSLVLGTGWFYSASAGLGFERAWQRTRFALRAAGSFRYYADSRQTTQPTYRVEMAVDTQAASERQSTFRFGLSAEHLPYYVLPLISTSAPVTGETAIVPTTRDDALYPQASNTLGESLGFDVQLSRRAFLRFSQDGRYTTGGAPGTNVREAHVAGAFGYRLSQYAALRLGYGYRTGWFGADTAQRLSTQDIDVGIDYRRPLFQSRRTTVGFTTGSSLVDEPGRRRWQFVGAANVRHEFTGGWFIQADLARATRLVQGFTAPFVDNSATASLGGFFGRRLELLMSAGYSRGEVGTGGGTYTALQGSTRLRLALARWIAIDGEGLYSKNRFSDQVVMPAGFPANLTRWTVRFNVVLWFALSR